MPVQQALQARLAEPLQEEPAGVFRAVDAHGSRLHRLGRQLGDHGLRAVCRHHVHLQFGIQQHAAEALHVRVRLSDAAAPDLAVPQIREADLPFAEQSSAAVERRGIGEAPAVLGVAGHIADVQHGIKGHGGHLPALGIDEAALFADPHARIARREIPHLVIGQVHAVAL